MVHRRAVRVEMLGTVAIGEGTCDDGMVNRPISYWVKRLDASLDTLLEDTLSRLSLSRKQWQVLTVLRAGPVTPAEMKEILDGFDSADGGVQEREMAALVRQRLVFLLDDRLSLTEAGSALLAEASGLVEATRPELTAGIGVDEYAMAVSVLERMSNNADRLAAR